MGPDFVTTIRHLTETLPHVPRDEWPHYTTRELLPWVFDASKLEAGLAKLEGIDLIPFLRGVINRLSWCCCTPSNTVATDRGVAPLTLATRNAARQALREIEDAQKIQPMESFVSANPNQSNEDPGSLSDRLRETLRLKQERIGELVAENAELTGLLAKCLGEIGELAGQVIALSDARQRLMTLAQAGILSAASTPAEFKTTQEESK